MTQWGGKRSGSGRPKGSGKHGEATRPVRIPASLVSAVQSFVQNRGYQLPLYGARVAAGFPAPAEDFLEGSLDLNEYLVQHPAATFFVRVTGDSMIQAGIFPGDLLIVDRSLEPVHKRIVIAIVNGELTVKRLIKIWKNTPSSKKNQNQNHAEEGKNLDAGNHSAPIEKIILQPENPAYAPIEISGDQELTIWGVVTNVIHAV